MRRVVLLLAIAVGAAAQTPIPVDWRFAPPDAQLVASVDLRLLGRELESLLRQGGFRVNADLRSLMRLDRVSLAVLMTGKEPEGLALLEGAFTASDLDEIRKALRVRPGEPVAVTMLDARRVLVGDREHVQRAMARMVAGASPDAVRRGELKPRVIRIEGLDSGPLEIPFGSAN